MGSEVDPGDRTPRVRQTGSSVYGLHHLVVDVSGPAFGVAVSEWQSDTLARRPYTGDASHHGIVLERLFDEEMVAIVAPSHRFAERRTLDVRALRDEGFVLRSRGSGLAHTITTATTAAGFTPVVVAECSSVVTLRSLVSAGIGVSIIPRSAAEAPGSPVVVLPLRPSLPSHTAAVAWRSDSRPSAAVEAMLGLVREQFAVARASSPRSSCG